MAYSIMTADTVKKDDGLVRWSSYRWQPPSWQWMRASMAVASLCLSRRSSCRWKLPSEASSLPWWRMQTGEHDSSLPLPLEVELLVEEAG
jgi:hypothetical protein